MKVYKNLEQFDIQKDTVVTIGNFDGCHIGHRKIISRVVELSKKYNFEPVLFTFNNHPMKHFGANIELIMSDEKKAEVIFSLGIKHLISVDFTDEFANMSAELFAREILSKKLNARYVVVGYDYRFGKKRQGDFELLKMLSSKLGFNAIKIDKVEIDNITVSSTNIRKLIKNGDIELANKMLGREFEMSGIVTDGDNLGRLIGYPTANISFDNYIIPKYGVYITKTVVGEKKYPSLTNVGIRPTIKDSNELRIETYILDFDSDIYGKKIDICFLKYLREEMKFETFDELKKKIDEDVRKAKDFFKIP
ncbi:MAG: riboflavin kinase / adenylyltransferase [Deferribacteres bacterium]|jgi:riboflavin kinase/FMN adenylyltransferase|nr:ribF [Deferribacteraceae bacterium]MDK2791404.1 riboflavin kinase / adenylyltransferase [Deferribacteres bacterium]